MRKAEQGFTYVALLFAVAIIGVGLAAKGVEWDRAAQRAREAELLFVGNEFRKAIALYYYRSPGPVQEYPRSLEELLEDPRYPGTQRYLRRIYHDPMTGKVEWGLVMSSDGRITGVHSLSGKQPIKSGNFSEANREFAIKNSYSAWQFTFAPVVAAAASQKGQR
jgi:type II secretory pathway pseudopilin PulG